MEQPERQYRSSCSKLPEGGPYRFSPPIRFAISRLLPKIQPNPPVLFQRRPEDTDITGGAHRIAGAILVLLLIAAKGFKPSK